MDALVAGLLIGTRGGLHLGARGAEPPDTVVLGALQQLRLGRRIGARGVGDGVGLGEREHARAQRGLGGRKLGDARRGVDGRARRTDRRAGGAGQPRRGVAVSAVVTPRPRRDDLTGRQRLPRGAQPLHLVEELDQGARARTVEAVGLELADQAAQPVDRTSQLLEHVTSPIASRTSTNRGSGRHSISNVRSVCKGMSSAPWT
jgi:hypothetical protein